MIYLNYAALCPTRPEAQQEVEATLAEFKPLLYSDEGLKWYQEKVSACRQHLANLINISDPSSIAFVPNASTASHLALSFIDWKPGDVILTSTHENPSIIREVAWLAHRGVKISTIPPTSPHDLLAAIEKQISTQPIRAILLSHVSHVDGRIFPIPEIGEMANQHNILFLVDGAQATGHIPINLDSMAVDLYFFPGHKWCQGPLGTGALIMKESFVSKNPAFAHAGVAWDGTQAGRFEIGTHNIGLIAGLAKSCQLKNEQGLRYKELEQIREIVKKQLGLIQKVSIKEWAGPHAPGMLTLQCRDHKDHKPLIHTLQNQFGIVVKQLLDYPDGETPAIRISWSGLPDRLNVSYALKQLEEFFKT